jgi:hypothetical protein
MAPLTPEAHLTKYVIDYYGGLMTRAEWLAHRAFLAEGKIQHGYAPELLEDLRTSDPDALSLMSHGVESFRLQVRERLLRDHQDKVFLNYCPKCGGLATTPKARQCCWCFHSWHRHDDEQST